MLRVASRQQQQQQRPSKACLTLSTLSSGDTHTKPLPSELLHNRHQEAALTRRPATQLQAPILRLELAVVVGRILHGFCITRLKL